jgi:hypothetical protein
MVMVDTKKRTGDEFTYAFFFEPKYSSLRGLAVYGIFDNSRVHTGTRTSHWLPGSFNI